MQLGLNDQQTALRAALERLIGDVSGARQQPDALWSALTEAGWLGLTFGDAHGGFDGSAVDAGLLMRVLGYHDAHAPYLSAILLGASSLACASQEHHLALLRAALRGETFLVLAHQEADRFDPAVPATLARRVPGGWTISGSKRASLGAPLASHLIVSAVLDESPNTLSLFLVPRDHPGVEIRAYLTVHGEAAADLDLALTAPEDALIVSVAEAGGHLRRVIDGAIAALCWDACGSMRALLEQTRDYTMVRKQFGRPLFDFQAVQHRLAEMAVCCEEAQAAAELAALQNGAADSTRARAASAAKLRVGTAARFVAHEAVQLHGAVGTTEELPVAGHFRRLLAFQTTLGSAQAHALRYAQAVLPHRAQSESAVLP
jgi:alkylation response protein AidB-like acyl-CoA dehydrogenase